MPGPVPRKAAKAQDSGLLSEAVVEKILVSRRVHIDAWRLPGIRTPRLTEVNYVPDGAAYIPDLDGLVPECIPEVKERPLYNTIIEVKSQKTPGSAQYKMGSAIEDLAAASDRNGAVGVMLLDVPALNENHVRQYKALGRLHSVVVLEASELTHDLFVSEVVRVAKERRRLMRRIGPKGGYTPSKRPSSAERGLAARISARNEYGVPLRKYGAHPKH